MATFVNGVEHIQVANCVVPDQFDTLSMRRTSKARSGIDYHHAADNYPMENFGLHIWAKSMHPWSLGAWKHNCGNPQYCNSMIDSMLM